VILYHPGSGQSYENNSAICEYLASHGYVVVTSAFQSRDDHQAGSEEFEPETSWRDMTFLITQSRLLRQADLLNTGALGYGAGAQYLLEWLSQRHPALGAVASLDASAGREMQQEDYAVQQKRISRLDPQNVPVLIAAPADSNQSFSLWERYLPCHSEAAPAQLTERDFILHGWLARLFRGDHPAEIRGQYDRLAQVLLAFFDAKLKGSTAAWQRLIREAKPGFRISPGACGGPG
jgi:dienelactone hydrolase